MRGSGGNGSGGDSDRAGAGDPAGAWGEFTVGVGGFRLTLSFRVGSGEILALFGPSGAGKTTALRAIAGLARPDAGRIVIAGRTVFAAGGNNGDGASGYDGNAGNGGDSDNRDGDGCGYGRPVWVAPHRRRVGYVTQQSHLFPHLTVAQNIAYGLPDRRGAAAQRRVAELVRRLRLDGLETRRVGQLSGGQRQRAALARALAPEPALLLLDEPFAALDMELRRALGAELRAAIRPTGVAPTGVAPTGVSPTGVAPTDIPATGVPAILVTHSREEALALGDTAQVIDGGRTVAVGPPLATLEQPGRGRVARLVGVENLLPMRVAARLPQDGTMVCVMAGDGGSGNGSGNDGDIDNDGGNGGAGKGAGKGGDNGRGGHRLETPLADGCNVGDAVTVGIRASDIILASGPLPQSSARNTWAGVVAGVTLRPPGYEVALDCGGVMLRCHITGASLEAMDIARGRRLWAIFKASSCFLLSE